MKFLLEYFHIRKINVKIRTSFVTKNLYFYGRKYLRGNRKMLQIQAKNYKSCSGWHCKCAPFITLKLLYMYCTSHRIKRTAELKITSRSADKSVLARTRRCLNCLIIMLILVEVGYKKSSPSVQHGCQLAKISADRTSGKYLLSRLMDFYLARTEKRASFQNKISFTFPMKAFSTISTEEEYSTHWYRH